MKTKEAGVGGRVRWAVKFPMKQPEATSSNQN